MMNVQKNVFETMVKELNEKEWYEICDTYVLTGSLTNTFRPEYSKKYIVLDNEGFHEYDTIEELRFIAYDCENAQ